MKRMTALLLLVAVVGASGLVVAVTSGGASKTDKAARDGAGKGAYAASTIAVRSTPLGRILVDAKGRTLYLFEADKPNVSACSGACTSLWPPLTSGAKPRARGGAAAAKIATIGERQVSYAGHPLYYYAGDQKPGDTAGQGLDQFGGKWYVLAPSGAKIDHD